MGNLSEIDERIKALSLERQQRKRDALRIYRPRSKKIETFHNSSASEKILRGGAGSGSLVLGLPNSHLPQRAFLLLGWTARSFRISTLRHPF